MGRTAKFLIVLVAGLAALTGVGYAVLTGTMRDWFEADLELRSRLAVAAANDSFDGQWPCLLYTSPSPRDRQKSRMPSSA